VKSEKFRAKTATDFAAIKGCIFVIENYFYISGNNFGKSVSNKIVRGKRG
jgi:hypothetical protein